MENIWIWIIVGLLLWQGMTLLQFLMFLYYKFRLPEYHVCQKDEIDTQVLKLIISYEKHLLEQGFTYKYAVHYKSMVVGSDLLIYKLYYYHEVDGIHAFLETTPYKGSLEPIKLSYDTIYESKKICSTENGMAHFIPIVPDDVYFFDHYLSSWDSVFEAHLKDRIIDGEKIVKQPFDLDGWLAYLKYSEHIYMDANIKNNVAKRTKEGYRYKASFALWKFAKYSTQGYRKFSTILKNKVHTVTPNDDTTMLSQTEGLVMQMEQVDKARGENSSKKRWFFISMLAFVVLFSIFGFSLADIVILVVVLFIHELGHFFAMRYFGYTDTNIFFMPFGAVTTGVKTKRTAYEEFIVSLMGPLPGILIGIGIIVYQFIYLHHIGSDSYLSMYAMMSLVINYINLLPIYPLDGGRILQTLLLLRYPKAQFYFYLIGVILLVSAMLWMQDPVLLIFVVIMALGLKQSYLISELLQILFKRYKQEDITKDMVASTLMNDEKFVKESLASKARIAKQALMIVDIIKPSKLLIVFGMGLFLLLLSPPVVIAVIGMGKMDQSPYTNLTKEGKIELRSFNETVQKYQGVTREDSVDYTLEDSMKILDTYLASSKIIRNIGETLKEPIDNSILPCKVSDEHLKVLHWHNGIERLLPYQKLLGYQELLDTYTLVKKENESYDEHENIEYVLSVGDEESYGLAYSCKENGLFDYSPYGYDNKFAKQYYNWNHFLKVTAEAYKQDIYKEANKKLYIDEKKLANLERKYYSSTDKKRYDEFVKYLKDRAEIYKHKKDTLLKITLLQTIGYTYDVSLLTDTKMYLKDTDKKVREQAIYTLGKVGSNSVLPLLLSYTKSKNNTERNFALLSISEIVHPRDKAILDSLYPLFNDEDILVRLSLYEVINKIEAPESLTYLRKYFDKETDRGKLSIIDIFSKFGTKNELPLLRHYLKKVNKMNMSEKDKGGFRGDNPHPKILKQYIEDSIESIESREIT